jgi:hypothetical protein
MMPFALVAELVDAFAHGLVEPLLRVVVEETPVDLDVLRYAAHQSIAAGFR